MGQQHSGPYLVKKSRAHLHTSAVLKYRNSRLAALCRLRTRAVHECIRYLLFQGYLTFYLH